MHCQTLLRLSIEEVNFTSGGEVTVDPQQNGKILVGLAQWTGGRSFPHPPVIPTLPLWRQFWLLWSLPASTAWRCGSGAMRAFSIASAAAALTLPHPWTAVARYSAHPLAWCCVCMDKSTSPQKTTRSLKTEPRIKREIILAVYSLQSRQRVWKWPVVKDKHIKTKPKNLCRPTICVRLERWMQIQ